VVDDLDVHLDADFRQLGLDRLVDHPVRRHLGRHDAEREAIRQTRLGEQVRFIQYDTPALKTGTYTIKVSDLSPEHSFHLSGPGVNKKTGVAFKGNVTWTVMLKFPPVAVPVPSGAVLQAPSL